MDDTQIDDFKQFIATTIAQHTADLVTKDDLKKLSTELGSKIDDLDLKVDTISVTLNENLDEHDARLKKLENQTA